MPSGCPSAIAPPFGLTFSASSSMPRSRSTASPCAANASLSSMTSILSRYKVGQLQCFSACRCWPNTHDSGFDANGSPRDDAGQRVKIVFFHLHHRTQLAKRTAPSLIPDALPAVTVPSLRTIGFSFSRPSIVEFRARMFVCVENDRIAAALRLR